MKSPKDLQKSEREEEERIKKENTRILKKSIDRAIKYSISAGELTSKGGNIELGSFNSEDEQFVIDFLKKHGWEASYHPKEKSSYSMTSRSDCYYTEHEFHLKPLE